MTWPEIPLGEVVDVKMGRQRSPKHASGDNMIPYLRAANVQDGWIDLGDVKTMNFDLDEQDRFQLVEGDVLVTEGSGSIDTVGASARWKAQIPGVVAFQNTLLRLRARAEVTNPAFVFHLARWLYWTGRWADVATGTNIFHIGSKRATALSVPVPRLAVQRRIGDLIDHIDEVVEAARVEELRTHHAWVACLRDRLEGFDGPTVGVDELATHIIGGAWGDPPGVEAVEVTALGPVAFNTGPAIDVSTGTERSLNERRTASRELLRGDIVLERSGGTDTQPVGRVIFATDNHRRVVPSDFMRLVRVDPSKANPEFVFWVMWTRWHRGDTVRFQSKTTNIRNLRVPDYLASPIAVPSGDRQEAFVRLARACWATHENVSSVVDASVRLRQEVLTAALNDELELEESYGRRFLDEVAG